MIVYLFIGNIVDEMWQKQRMFCLHNGCGNPNTAYKSPLYLPHAQQTLSVYIFIILEILIDLIKENYNSTSSHGPNPKRNYFIPVS